MNKIRTITLILLSTLVACSTNINNNSDFNVLSEQPTPTQTKEPTFFDQNKIPFPDNSLGLLLNDNIKKDIKTNFDYLPPEGTYLNDGSITVIFKNNAKIRINKTNKKLKSMVNVDISELEKVLNEEGLVQSFDLGSYISDNDDKLDNMYNEYVTENKIDIPHLRSIHYYRVSEKSNTKLLCKKLMQLPFVRLAYPSPKLVSIHESLISNIPYHQLTPNSNYDPETNTNNSNFMRYYWFHEHEVFKAKGYYNNFVSQKPKIAIIDLGFDSNSPELNLSQGYSIFTPLFNSPYIISGINCPNNNCINATTIEQNHGNKVAYIAGAKNNGSYGEGIASDAQILPIKTEFTVSGINIGIGIAKDDPTVDAINLSIALSNPFDGTQYPISFDPSINTAISYAVQANKPVAIGAGNKYQALNPPDNYSSDAVVVGGTMPIDEYNNTQHYKIWSSGGFGSNHFYRYSQKNNPIDIAAAAYKIYFLDYDPTNNSRLYSSTNGTSLATPMVTATLGLMKKINPSLNAKKLKDILIYSSNVRTFDGTSNSTNYILGKDLKDNAINNSFKVGIRDLNTYNALVIAKNINNPNYVALGRTYNSDDAGLIDQATTAFSYPGYSYTGFGDDKIWGFTSSGGNYINYGNYNNIGDCAYGFQVYTNQYQNFAKKIDAIGGVTGISGLPCSQGAWNNKMSVYIY